MILKRQYRLLFDDPEIRVFFQKGLYLFFVFLFVDGAGGIGKKSAFFYKRVSAFQYFLLQLFDLLDGAQL